MSTTIETKKELITDDYIISFDIPLPINTERVGEKYILTNQTLCIRTDSVYKFALEVEDLCLKFFGCEKITAESPQTELERDQFKYLEKIGASISKKEKKKTKKRVNSRAKGQRGEKAVIKALGSHFPGLNIYRTPGSGAFATTHNMASEDNILSGDLLAENNEPIQYKRFIKYNWEIKNYSTIANILELYFKKSCDLTRWIDQAERDATNNKKIFTLIFKSNYSPIFIIFKDKYVKNKLEDVDYLVKFNYKRNSYYVYFLQDVRF